MIDLSGRVIIVTGGNSAIGLGIARGVARAGASVAIWSRRQERNAEAVAELAGLGATAIGVQRDVSDEDNVAGAIWETLVRFGRLDCLVANAGTTGKQSFTDMSLDEWHRVLHVNLDGAFLCSREAARVLVGQGQGGSLVDVSSTSAIDGAPGQQPAPIRHRRPGPHGPDRRPGPRQATFDLQRRDAPGPGRLHSLRDRRAPRCPHRHRQIPNGQGSRYLAGRVGQPARRRRCFLTKRSRRRILTPSTSYSATWPRLALSGSTVISTAAATAKGSLTNTAISANATVPRREPADLVATFPDVPRFGDQLDLRDDRILLDQIEKGGEPVHIMELPGQRRGQVEPEPVHMHVQDPVPRTFGPVSPEAPA